MTSSIQSITGTYRLQLHKGFTLHDVEGLINYLHQLGVSTIYASPLFQAVPGSMHGYDVTDPHVVNKEIGTKDQLVHLAAQLKEKGMNWLQDIVPNHMAFHADNYRLMDVLERGPDSPYFGYFDIDWEHPDASLHGKVLLPFLGTALEDCVKNQQIRLTLEDKGPGFAYGDKWYPLSISAYDLLKGSFSEHKAVAAYLRVLAEEASNVWEVVAWQAFKSNRYQQLLRETGWAAIPTAICDKINEDALLLLSLLKRQYYLLAHYRDASATMNYRRFFTVNELICLRMEDAAVFDEYHRLIADLPMQGLVQGLRIDHIDGLQDPAGYIQRLRKLVGDDCYLIAEKILEAEEGLPDDWVLEGTSGYEFLSFTNRLLMDAGGREALHRYYTQLIPGMPAYISLVQEKKRLILEEYMQGEWDNLTGLFYRLPGRPGTIDRLQMKDAIGAFLVLLPVYRLYPAGSPLPDAQQRIIDRTFNDAFQQYPAVRMALQFLQDIWNDRPGLAVDARQRIAVLQRLMQFTGPLTAKGVEDTVFYVFNALLSRNEVGDDPSAPVLSAEGFHALMQQRLQHTPLSLNATSTHDTKRGEDGRLRLNILTLFAAEWAELVEGWRATYNGNDAPDINDQYFIFQSLVAGFPIDGQVTEAFRNRLCDYIVKALHEAKVRSNWTDPDEGYEKRCIDLIHQLLDDQSSFLPVFKSFMARIDSYLPLYSIAQTLLKITAPGIPDIYQGCELWDLSYVDPDNRRPVDYVIRQSYLSNLIRLDQQGSDALLSWVDEHAASGAGKMLVTWKGLHLRRSNPALFLAGDYIPVYPNRPAPVIAFLRRYQGAWVLVAAPLLHQDIVSPGHSLWKDVYLSLPDDAAGSYRNVLTGETFIVRGGLSLEELFRVFPAGLCAGS